MIPIKTIPLVTGRAEEWANGCEQFAVHLTYDLKPLLEKWPDAVPSVAFERADGEKYPHAWEQEEDVLHIPLTKADTAIAGLCKCVVTVTSGDGQHNSDVFHGRVSQGLDTLVEEPDEPMQGIIEQVNGAAVRAESAANNAADDAQAAQADAETANAAALAAVEQAQNAASAAVRSESGATRAEEAAERAENAEVPPELIADMIESYLEENPPEAPVQSVNGQTGVVKLTAKDVGALPEETEIPKPYTLPVATADVLGGVKIGSGLKVLEDGTLSATAESVGALPKTYEAPVLSVNGETGEVELTAEDVGAAPAGYGLGYEVETAIKNNPDNIIGTGFYRCAISINGSQAWWIGTHEQLYADNSFAYQRFTSFDGTTPRTVQRLKMNGTWGEWEWENPPMVSGVEYRTTERYEGKSVYTMFVNYGTAVNDASGNLPNGTEKLIRHAGSLNSMTLPLGNIVKGTNYAHSFYATSGTKALKLATDSVFGGGNYTWYENLWYTKS